MPPHPRSTLTPPPHHHQIVRTASFTSSRSYIEMYASEVERKFEMSMRVKTLQGDGLLYYAFEMRDQMYALSLGLSGGRFVVKVTSKGQHTELASVVDKYADGHWHYVSVEIVNRRSVYCSSRSMRLIFVANRIGRK